MATLGVLRKTAKDLGIAPGDIRSATSAAELQVLIVEALNGGTTSKAKPKPAARKTSTRTAARKTATATRSGTAKRGRPAGTASAKSKPAAKSTTGKAKRSTSNANGNGGRNMLSGVNYSETDGWNAREGSAPDLIVSALRRFKGNREKVFNHLLPNIWDFVGRKMADGSKRTKESAETMLRYRISRTAWDFAMKTGQHEKSENRAEYGTQGTYKKPGATKATGTRRTAAKAQTARKPARAAAKPQRAAQKRTAAPKRTRTVAKAKTTTKKPVAKKKTTARR